MTYRDGQSMRRRIKSTHIADSARQQGWRGSASGRADGPVLGPGRAGLIDLMALCQESELCCSDHGAEGAQVAAQAGGGGPGDLALRQVLVVRLNQLLVLLLDLLGVLAGRAE